MSTQSFTRSWHTQTDSPARRSSSPGERPGPRRVLARHPLVHRPCHQLIRSTGRTPPPAARRYRRAGPGPAPEALLPPPRGPPARAGARRPRPTAPPAPTVGAPSSTDLLWNAGGSGPRRTARPAPGGETRPMEHDAHGTPGWVVAADGGRPEGRNCSHLEQPAPGTGLPGRRRLRGMRRPRHHVGPPAGLSDLWSCRLLRQFAGAARHRPPRAHRAPGRPLRGARRGLGVVLRGRGVPAARAVSARTLRAGTLLGARGAARRRGPSGRVTGPCHAGVPDHDAGAGNSTA